MNHSYTMTFKTLPATFQEKFTPKLELIRKSCGLDHLKRKKKMPADVLKWMVGIHIYCEVVGIFMEWPFKQASAEIATPALLWKALRRSAKRCSRLLKSRF